MAHRSRSQVRDYSNVTTIDRLAFGRAQHFQSRENRPKSVSEDDAEGISDWSDSDRECDLISDVESIPDMQENDRYRDHYHVSFDEDIKENKSAYLNTSLLSTNSFHGPDIPLSYVDDSPTSTQVLFGMDNEKLKQQFDRKTSINSMRSGKHLESPLLPARHIPSRQMSSYRSLARSTTNMHTSSPIRNPKITTRPYLHREMTSSSINFNSQLTDSTLSSHSLLHTHENNLNRRQTLSPCSSQASIPRAYEMKKIFVDDYDYGRITETPLNRPPQPRNRQKWGTIVHPPFPLGYQQIAPDQVTQAVERLASPVRCRDRHTHAPNSTKRYLSIEETDALINRLTKVKTIRSPDHYYSSQPLSRSVKTLNNHWKGVSIPA